MRQVSRTIGERRGSANPPPLEAVEIGRAGDVDHGGWVSELAGVSRGLTVG